MRTAIFTVNPKTTLTIETSEAVEIVQMGRPDAPIRLTPGANTVGVGAGVFKVLSTEAVQVTADTQDVGILSTANDKDGNWPDPQLSAVTVNASRTALQQFFATAAKRLSMP